LLYLSLVPVFYYDKDYQDNFSHLKSSLKILISAEGVLLSIAFTIVGHIYLKKIKMFQYSKFIEIRKRIISSIVIFMLSNAFRTVLLIIMFAGGYMNYIFSDSLYNDRWI